jgi:acyl dehydratase
MTAEHLTPDLLGTRFERETVSWNPKDVMLYSLGVGCKPAAELDYLYEGRGPKVLPTYAVIPAMRAMGNIGKAVKLELMRLLHGEQSIELFRPLPATAELSMDSSITELWDKGKAAVIGVSADFSDADGPVFRTHATLFYMGGGGFGGQSGPSTKDKNRPPDRKPDLVVDYATSAEQGAIYRLSGDRVPLHIDPDFAAKAGYDKPFMHGLCTYGFVGRAVLHSLCGGDPVNFRSMQGRFSERVEFEDRIITKIWKTQPGEAIIQAETQNGAVTLSQGLVRFEPGQ